MKRFIITIVSIFLIFCNSSILTFAKPKSKVKGEDLAPEAHYAIAIDSTTKKILYEKNARLNVPMASTTKIVTSLLAINYGNLDELVTISSKAASIRGAKVGYKVGEQITLRELIWGLMFKSGNDAAIAIAEHLGGSVENFSVLMNDFGKMIGLIDSNFESPHGLDSNMHFSSAYDLAIATSKAMENKMFSQIVGSKELLMKNSGFTRDYRNINKILWKIPNANGVKTGYTGQAGKCLVTSVREKDTNIIIVVLNCPERWEVTKRIYENVKDKI